MHDWAHTRWSLESRFVVVASQHLTYAERKSCAFMPAFPCRGQHKQSVCRWDFMSAPLPFRKRPRNTEPAHRSAFLSPPSWTLIFCSWLYTLYSLHYLPLPASPSLTLYFLLIGFLRPCPSGFKRWKKKIKCYLQSNWFAASCCFFANTSTTSS